MTMKFKIFLMMITMAGFICSNARCQKMRVHRSDGRGYHPPSGREECQGYTVAEGTTAINQLREDRVAEEKTPIILWTDKGQKIR